MGSGGYSAWFCRGWGWYSVAETAYHRLQGTDSWAKLRGHIVCAILPSTASQPHIPGKRALPAGGFGSVHTPSP